MIALRGLHSGLRGAAEEAVDLALSYGVSPFITSVYRSWEEQARLRRQYERCVREGRFPTPGTECAYPANQPGDSAHNWGLAWDSVAEWDSEAGELWWAQYGITDPMTAWTYIRRYLGWEVFDHDLPHAQLPHWRQYAPADRMTSQAGYTGG